MTMDKELQSLGDQTRILNQHFLNMKNVVPLHTYFHLTDSGNGVFFQVLHHLNKKLIACNLPKVYPRRKNIFILF